jgi:hypothetical protein
MQLYGGLYPWVLCFAPLTYLGCQSYPGALFVLRARLLVQYHGLTTACVGQLIVRHQLCTSLGIVQVQREVPRVLVVPTPLLHPWPTPLLAARRP